MSGTDKLSTGAVTCRQVRRQNLTGPQEDIIRMKRFRLAAIFGGVAEDPVPRLPSDLRDMQQRFPLMDQGIDPASDDHPGKAGLDLPSLLAQRV